MSSCRQYAEDGGQSTTSKWNSTTVSRKCGILTSEVYLLSLVVADDKDASNAPFAWHKVSRLVRLSVKLANDYLGLQLYCDYHKSTIHLCFLPVSPLAG